ncbi:PAS domain-containing protein [Sphingomonas sp. NFR15]|uniref:PAS domain-containing protein n=1 Tax=Sphingomonas sp. NFR15 TaxID=1566282 RepID=UPI00088A3C3B|nr:PAS domain-containing protein [Sphingomonas sp. NFR15]SDA29759.1 PAS fold-containing protein [Sphingomonas sp. NFR15]
MSKPAMPPHQVATASDLVRRFGYWQGRAAHAPVYILHRGRARLVLTSVEIMDALCATHPAGQSGLSPDLAAVLDRIDDRVLLADTGQRIVGASIAARNAFGALAEPGATLAGLVTESARSRLAISAERALRTAAPVALDLPMRLNSGHRLNLLIDAWPGGLMLIARDPSDPRADADALAAAITATGNVAAARIDTRGHLESASPALASLCGQPAEALAGTAFAALFAPASQQAVRDTLDRVFTSAARLQITAMLPSGQGAARRARIGLAPRRAGAAINGITALLVVPPG